MLLSLEKNILSKVSSIEDVVEHPSSTYAEPLSLTERPEARKCEVTKSLILEACSCPKVVIKSSASVRLIFTIAHHREGAGRKVLACLEVVTGRGYRSLCHLRLPVIGL